MVRRQKASTPGDQQLQAPCWDIGQALSQGLLQHLGPQSLLTARLVCQQWRTHVGAHITTTHLPPVFWSQRPKKALGQAERLAAAFPQCASLLLLMEKGTCSSSKILCQEHHTGQQQQQGQQQGQQQQAVAEVLAPLAALPGLHSLSIRGPLTAAAWSSLNQQLAPLGPGLRSLRLDLVVLPASEHLRQLLQQLPGLVELVLLPSMRSRPLQGGHLEALAAATQLRVLQLAVSSTDAGEGVQLSHLVELSQLRSLDVAYHGIMQDQRFVLRPPSLLSRLTLLTHLASHNCLQPLLPHPSMPSCCSLAATGLYRRLSKQQWLQLGSCVQLVRLVLDSRFKSASVVADHLDQLAQLTQLTHLTFGLSKGTFRAATTGQQLLQLTRLGRLRELCMAADHRVVLGQVELGQLAASCTRLQRLALLNVDYPDGVQTLGGFSELETLSLWFGKGNTGAGAAAGGGASAISSHQQLAGLGLLLRQLPRLADLRLNSKSLSLEQLLELQQQEHLHGEEEEEGDPEGLAGERGGLSRALAPDSSSSSSGRGLRSLALNLNSRLSNEETVQVLAGVPQLRHLQLSNVKGSFMRRAAVQAALGGLSQLLQLGILVDEANFVWELSKVPKQFRFLGQLQGLQELVLFMGLGISERHLRQALTEGELKGQLPEGCRVRLLAEQPDVFRLAWQPLSSGDS